MHVEPDLSGVGLGFRVWGSGSRVGFMNHVHVSSRGTPMKGAPQVE